MCSSSAGMETDIVLAADLTADGKMVALGGPGKVVKVYSIPDGKLLYQITKHTDWITALEFSPDGSRLATADRSGGMHLWERATGDIVVSLSEHKDSVTAISWRGDGALLASCGEDGQLIIWDAREGWPLSTTANAHGPKRGILSLQLMPDGRLLSVGRDRTVRVWGADGKQRAAMKESPVMLTKVAAAWDGKLSAAGDYEGHVSLWDGRQTSTLTNPSSPRATAE
jgi:WD40 repeat protein